MLLFNLPICLNSPVTVLIQIHLMLLFNMFEHNAINDFLYSNTSHVII